MKLIDVIVASEGHMLFRIDYIRSGLAPFTLETIKDQGLKNHCICDVKTILDVMLPLGPAILQNPEAIIKDFILVKEMDNRICCCIELVDIEIAQDDESCYHKSVSSNIERSIAILVRKMGMDLSIDSKIIESWLFRIKCMVVNLFQKEFYYEYKNTIAFLSAYLIYATKEEKISAHPREFARFERDPIAYVANFLIFKSDNAPFLNEINLLDIMPLLYHFYGAKYSIKSSLGRIERVGSSDSIKDSVAEHVSGIRPLYGLTKKLSTIQIADIYTSREFADTLHIHEKNIHGEDHRCYSMIRFKRIMYDKDNDWIDVDGTIIPAALSSYHKNILNVCKKKGLYESLSVIYTNKESMGIMVDSNRLIYAMWKETPIEYIYIYRKLY